MCRVWVLKLLKISYVYAIESFVRISVDFSSPEQLVLKIFSFGAVNFNVFIVVFECYFQNSFYFFFSLKEDSSKIQFSGFNVCQRNQLLCCVLLVLLAYIF